MSVAENALILSIIVEMMVIGFGLLFYIFRHERISSRVLFSILGILLFISSVSVAISNSFFWKGSLVDSIGLLVASGLVFVVPFRAGKDNVDWRSSLRYTLPAVTVLLSFEVAMGFFYGSAFLPHSINPITLIVDNLDFSIMMVIDALFFFAIARQRKSLPEFALLTFALSMAIMPNFFIFYGKATILASAVASSVIMVLNVVFLYIIQMKRKEFKNQSLSLALAAMDLIMMIGLVFYALNQNIMLMSYAMIASMAVYFFLVTHKLSSRPVTTRFGLSFGLLLLINAAELAMSLGVTTLGFSISNSLFPHSGNNFGLFFSTLHPGLTSSINYSNPFWWIFPFDPGKMSIMAFHQGLSVGVPFAYFWSSFMLIMMTTMSPFYAIMMGSEMSYLVLDRYKATKNRKVRNWALAIIAGIPLFVILIPFYSPFYIFGMSGMLYSVPLVIFLISIAAVIVGSIILGRRFQCNLVCMAAHMWTNSYYDQFKPSKDHRYAWTVLRWLSFGLMLVSFGLFLMQQLGVASPIRIGMITINPLDFYGMFVLNYIWWFFYFLTPVFGTYSCSRQGWCGFGTLAGIFNKFFFRIKAKTPTVCETCPSRSCESTCPAAIPLSADFQKKGFSNRISCIGCGNCVEACELDNLDLLDFSTRRTVLAKPGGKTQ